MSKCKKHTVSLWMVHSNRDQIPIYTQVIRTRSPVRWSMAQAVTENGRKRVRFGIMDGQAQGGECKAQRSHTDGAEPRPD